jgi:hypothetical protein
MIQSEEPPNTSSRASAASVASAFMNAFNELGRSIAPPEKVETHFREARKQVLLGLRELIDDRIEKMSKAETKGTRIVVE